ncbi:unnamed protein product, partial [Ectocarpus sp. 4 AP-2014]
RTFIIAIVAITYLLGLLKPPSVFALGVWCFSGFAALFPLIFAALYWKGLTKAGAYAGILATISAWLYFFLDAASKGVPAIRTYTVDLTVGGQTYETMAVLWIFLASAVATVAVSLVTPKPNTETLAKFFPNAN